MTGLKGQPAFMILGDVVSEVVVNVISASCL